MGSQHKPGGSPSSSGGGNNSSSYSNSDSISSSAVTKTKKYKFHPDYAAAIAGGGERQKRAGKSATANKHAKRHPFENDDEFWQKKYKLVNYRKKYPEDFDENLFKTLYDWITNGNKGDYFSGQGESILFKDGGGKIGGGSGVSKTSRRVTKQSIRKVGEEPATTRLAVSDNETLETGERKPRRAMSTESVHERKRTVGGGGSDSEPPWSSQPQPAAGLRGKPSGRQRQKGNGTRRSSSMNVIKKNS